MKLVEASIDALQGAMQTGEARARELVEGYLDRIAAYDRDGPALAAVTRLAPGARDEADALDAERARGETRGPLHGVPFLVKDNMDVKGLPTSAGAAALEGLVADRDAAVVARLRDAGAIVLGKTNLHELAAGITTVSSAGGRTRNPYDPERNPGGSSGGTAAAVAASFAAFGTGSDTCGSIRVPAAQNALVGLRPTQGTTSLDGVVPLCLTQDVVGPLARTTRDLAIALDAMLGDAAAAGGFAAAAENASLAGRRIGRLDTLFGGEPADDEVADRVREALDRLASAGAEIVPVALPELEPLLDVGFTVILAEVADDFAGYLAECRNAPVRSLSELLETGTVHPEVAPVLAAAASGAIRELPAYAEARANRERLRVLLEDALASHGLDALAYPPILRVAAPLGEEQPGSNAHAAANSGLPAISLPAGSDGAGHPVGLELLGARGADARLVGLAAATEEVLAARVPPTTTPER